MSLKDEHISVRIEIQSEKYFIQYSIQNQIKNIKFKIVWKLFFMRVSSWTWLVQNSIFNFEFNEIRNI